MSENENKSFFDLIDNSKETFLDEKTPILEDSNSNLSLLDQSLTNEEILNYLSLLNDNSFSLADELDIENSIKPCSSINSNATTVSTQETNEFRESLLNSSINDIVDIQPTDLTNVFENTDKNFDTLKTSSPLSVDNLLDNQTNQLDISNLEAHFNSFDSYDNLDSSFNKNLNNTLNESTSINKIDQNLINNFPINQINNYQNSYSNYNNQISFNSLYPMNQMNTTQYDFNKNVDNSQINYFFNNCNNSIISNGSLTNFNSSNSINVCDINNCNTFNNNITNSNYIQNDFLTYTECRDVNCPYTYCSRYNPYLNNYFSIKNQIKQNSNLTNNFLSNTSINMNLIDNQIVFNKTNDQFLDKNLTNQTNSSKKIKRKLKNEVIETSVICNESTDYTFYTIEENSQLKKKRGRKRKTEDLLSFN